jgi:GT2 family glycosyltransferase
MNRFNLEMGNEDKLNKKENMNKRKNDKYNRILIKNKQILDDTLPSNPPMVSIIILNRNGAMFLNDFFNSFKENTIYKNYEIIVVDNGSTDKSISILRSESNILPLQIIRNKENKNFSQGCNQGAKHAKGDYILLINNDTQPTYGWLNEMVKCALRTSKAGAICPKILYPNNNKKNKALLVQQIGMTFKKDGKLFKPQFVGDGYKPYDDRVNKEEGRLAVSAAVLLVKKHIYFEVGGLDENYNYGYEDVDFSLELSKRGYVNMYCPTALIFHHLWGTQKKVDWDVILKRREKNIKIFHNKWAKWLKENINIESLG